MNEQKRIQIIREVSLCADLPGFYEKSEALGNKAATALTRKKRAQISGLENIANSALNVTDVFDFIKVRSARHKEWQEGNWGPELLNLPARQCGTEKRTASIQASDSQKYFGLGSGVADGILVHLLLIREFVRQMAAQYEYACYKDKGGEQ